MAYKFQLKNPTNISVLNTEKKKKDYVSGGWGQDARIAFQMQ